MWRLVFGERFRRKIVTIKGALEGSRPLPTVPTDKGRRGEQCSPVQFSGNTSPRERAMLAPTATVWLRSHHWLPLRGAPLLGGEGWARELEPPPSHPSVTFGDSSPQGEPSSTPIESFWPRRGQSVGRRKSVKKNAALLHFLAFSSNDLLFGVLRGEQPLSRASRAIGSSGHLFRFLFGCPKRKATG